MAVMMAGILITSILNILNYLLIFQYVFNFSVNNSAFDFYEKIGRYPLRTFFSFKISNFLT